MRARLIALTVSVVALFAARTADAQIGIWLQRGVNGFGGSALLGYVDGDVSLGVSGGYSYQGWLDFGLGVTFISHGTDFVDGADVSAVAISPGIDYHPIKQSDNLPFSLSLGVNFGYTLFAAEEFDAAGYELEGYSIGANANLYRFFKLGSNTGVIPAAGVGYVYGELSDNAGLSASSDFAQIALGIYLAYLDSSNRIWGLVPAVQIPITGENTVVSYSLALTLVFSQPPPEVPE
jgi:hypothetical protein